MSKNTDLPGAGWTTQPNNVFQLGRGKTLAVPMSIHQSARRKLVHQYRSNGIMSGIILLQGGLETNQYDTDTSNLFR